MGFQVGFRFYLKFKPKALKFNVGPGLQACRMLVVSVSQICFFLPVNPERSVPQNGPQLSNLN